MATISFDREIKISKESVDRLLDVLETKENHQKINKDLASEKSMQEGREQLKKYFSPV